MRALYPYISIFIFLFATNGLHAQTNSDSSVNDSAAPVLRMDYNVILNDTTLRGFYAKLEELKQGKRDKVTILHIGDSHIQGDYFSGAIRTGIQEIFGSAGRGLVFPYSLAKTYAPADLNSSSDIAWTPKRNFFYEDSVPLGITGYALVCNQDNFKLKMGVKGSNDRFDRVCILHGNDSTCYDLGVYRQDDNSPGGLLEMGTIGCYDTTDNKWAQHTVSLDTKVDEFIISPLRTDNQQYQTRIYGFVLENSQDKGILYNTAGVGAAQLINFTRTSAFVDQAAALKPDLVIFSLGTNESYSTWFDTLAYQNLIETVISQIRSKAPEADFIFTTPPDIVFRGKYPKYMDPVCRAIKRAAVNADFAVWDLNTVMGGAGSMNQWHTNLLSQNDHIHFKSAGYKLQGYMFLDALMYSYNQVVQQPIDVAYLADYIDVHQPTYSAGANKPVVVQTAKNTSTSGKYHKVRSGESLYGISRKYGTTVAKLCKLNGISKNSIIRPGQKLRVR